MLASWSRQTQRRWRGRGRSWRPYSSYIYSILSAPSLVTPDRNRSDRRSEGSRIRRTQTQPSPSPPSPTLSPSIPQPHLPPSAPAPTSRNPPASLPDRQLCLGSQSPGPGSEVGTRTVRAGAVRISGLGGGSVRRGRRSRGGRRSGGRESLAVPGMVEGGVRGRCSAPRRVRHGVVRGGNGR